MNRHRRSRVRERAESASSGFEGVDTASSGFERETADHVVEEYASSRSSSGTSKRLELVFTQLIPTNEFSQFEFPKCGEQ